MPGQVYTNVTQQNFIATSLKLGTHYDLSVKARNMIGLS